MAITLPLYQAYGFDRNDIYVNGFFSQGYLQSSITIMSEKQKMELESLQNRSLQKLILLRI